MEHNKSGLLKACFFKIMEKFSDSALQDCSVLGDIHLHHVSTSDRQL